MKKEIYNEDLSYYRNPDFVRVIMFDDGSVELTKKDGEKIIQDWYKDARTGRPFIPKRRNFISLVKQILREDY